MRVDELQSTLKQQAAPGAQDEAEVSETVGEVPRFVELPAKHVAVTPWVPAGRGRWTREILTAWQFPGRCCSCRRLVVQGVFNENGDAEFIAGFEDEAGSWWLTRRSFVGSDKIDHATPCTSLSTAQGTADAQAQIRWAPQPGVQENG